MKYSYVTYYTFLPYRRGRGAILIEPLTTVGRIGTLSSSYIEIGIHLVSTPIRDQTPIKVDEEEVEYLRAQDYQITRIISVSYLKNVRPMLFRVHKEALRWLTLLDEAIDPSTYLTPSSKPLSVSLCIDSVVRALTKAYTRPADLANLNTCCRFTRTSRTPSQRELLKRIKRGRGKLRRRSQLVDARLHKSVINRHYH